MNDAWQSFLSGIGSAATSPIFALSATFSIAVAVFYHWAIARPSAARSLARTAGSPAGTAAPDVTDLRTRIASLESGATGALQSVGFVRFNAFPDVGSELSYALAVVDGRGDGFVVSSIYSREEVRTYAKAVKGFAADKEVSSEERQALEIARARYGGRAGARP
jgi:hypothetical protein